MTPYIIAEVAQGYEGDPATAQLLVRCAKAGGADAVKFQIVFADDLCEPGYEYHALFTDLEMDASEWRAVAAMSRKEGLAFVADVFGRRALAVAQAAEADAYKIHSTAFFDDSLVSAVLAIGKPVYLSVGGIHIDEIAAFMERHNLRRREDIAILFGYQAEPTPIEGNNLARIDALRRQTGLEVGFMDHSDGDGPDWLSLSVLALGMGVRLFEKHVTLERSLQMEDYVSALEPSRLKVYTDSLRRLATAVGTDDLTLTQAERGYRARALKRVLAARDLPAGHRIEAGNLRLNRPAAPRGLYLPTEAVGRTLGRAVTAGEPIDAEDLV